MTMHFLQYKGRFPLGGNFRAERNFSLPCDFSGGTKGRFPLGGIFRAERNFSLSFLISSTREIIRQRKIPLRAENSA